MVFTRTPQGLAEKWRFHNVPTIWVEGPTDIYFYYPVLDSIPSRIEAFHGTENAKALIDALVSNNYPYLVILDGDYNILKATRRPHRCVIMLDRYSFENYFWESESVNRACLRHIQCGDDKDIVSAEMDRVTKHLAKELLPAVVLDVAARHSPSPPIVLPEHIDHLMLDKKQPDVDPAKIAHIIDSVSTQLDRNAVKEAQSAVNGFLANRCITHLLKGHLVFGVLRRVFLQTAGKERGQNVTIPNDSFIQLLSDMMWRRCGSKDHKALKRKIRSSARKLVSQYPVTGSPTRE